MKITYEQYLTDYINTSYCSFNADDVLRMRAFNPDTDYAVIIKNIADLDALINIKDKLLKVYPEGISIELVNEGVISKIILKNLDKQRVNNAFFMISKSKLTDKKRFNFNDLIRIVYRLRDPDGCKWDTAQDHMTIRNNAVEEAYELVEAVEMNNTDKMREESGDVLLQGVFHSIIAESKNEFDYNDMITELCSKLISRHTHIFGNVVANTPEEALKAWENAKAIEKSYESYNGRIQAIAKTLPAMTKAYKIQKIAKKCGFDWKDINDCYNKIDEEIIELKTAKNEEEKELEAGDVLFAVINALRMLNIDPELALNRTNNKFINRFKYMEDKATLVGKKLDQLNLIELEELWQEAKRCE